MTDLPRFTGGSLGPIGFNQVNEMMRRLDALRPLIESVELSQNRIDSEKESVMVVYAKKIIEEDPEKGSIPTYEWREIAIKNNDAITAIADDDWIETNDLVVTRGGGKEGEDPDESDESDMFAVSVMDFNEGYAICFARRTLDGTRRYVLLPLVASDSNLFIIESIVSESGSVPYTDASGSAPCFIYTALQLNLVLKGDDVHLEKGKDPIFFYDFGLAEVNKPSVPDGTELEEVPLKAGTIFQGSTMPIGDIRIGYLAILPRFDVECT